MVRLIADVCSRLVKVFPSGGLMVFVATPEPTAWVPLPETRKGFKHFPGCVGFEHNLCGLNGILFWDVDQEMDMVEGKAEVTKLEPEAFQVKERLDADVDVDLLSETVVSVVGDEHHRHPVVAGVTRNLFRATAIYILHKDFSPVASVKGGRMPAARDKTEYSLAGEKEMRLFICGSYAVASDHAVFPVATIKKQIIALLLHLYKHWGKIYEKK